MPFFHLRESANGDLSPKMANPLRRLRRREFVGGKAALHTAAFSHLALQDGLRFARVDSRSRENDEVNRAAKPTAPAPNNPPPPPQHSDNQHRQPQKAHAPMMEFAQVVKRSAKNIIALDGVSDPQNLGAIVRTAAAFDIGAIVMARAASAPMNAAAIRVAGANANCVSIVRVGNLRRALKTLWQNDWRTIAVDERGEESFFDSVLSASRLCWVFGGEDRGLRPIVRAACELSARVPSVAGDVGCLNVAAAVAGCLALARLALRRG